jgi:hypothetical protein
MSARIETDGMVRGTKWLREPVLFTVFECVNTASRTFGTYWPVNMQPHERRAEMHNAIPFSSFGLAPLLIAKPAPFRLFLLLRALNLLFLDAPPLP